MWKSPQRTISWSSVPHANHRCSGLVLHKPAAQSTDSSSNHLLLHGIFTAQPWSGGDCGGFPSDTEDVLPIALRRQFRCVRHQPLASGSLWSFVLHVHSRFGLWTGHRWSMGGQIFHWQGGSGDVAGYSSGQTLLLYLVIWQTTSPLRYCVFYANLQVLFILESVQRLVTSQKEASTKPGRSVVTFLLSLNIANWLVNTLGFKLSESLGIYKMYYSITVWKIVVRALLPLSIFFRFQAAICLSDLRLSMYEPVKK